MILRIPAEVKNAIAEAAAENGRSVNDFAGQVLSARYGIPYVPSGRTPGVPAAPAVGSEPVNVILRLPTDLYDAIAYDAFSTRSHLNTVATRALAAAVGLSYEPPATGAPRRRRRA